MSEAKKADAILAAGTFPLPYVQRGMMLRHVGPDDRWWRVSQLYQSGDRVFVVLVREHAQGPAVREVVNTQVRSEWMLVRDFDPAGAP